MVRFTEREKSDGNKKRVNGCMTCKLCLKKKRFELIFRRNLGKMEPGKLTKLEETEETEILVGSSNKLWMKFQKLKFILEKQLVLFFPFTKEN